MRSFTNIRVEVTDAIATVTVDRPKALNALNRETIAELQTAFDSLAGMRAVIVTGAGERAFVAGADIVEMASFGPQEALALSRQGLALMRTLERAPMPVLAAVRGYALGGGLELALACDVIYASKDSTFGLPEAALGVTPGFGGLTRLVRRVGIGAARELAFTGARIDATEALALGLVRAVYEPEELLARVRKIAAEIATRAPLAIAAAKRALTGDPKGALAAALEVESEAFADLFATHDQKEGMTAFLEKREPRWTSS